VLRGCRRATARVRARASARVCGLINACSWAYRKSRPAVGALVGDSRSDVEVSRGPRYALPRPCLPTVACCRRTSPRRLEHPYARHRRARDPGGMCIAATRHPVAGRRWTAAGSRRGCRKAAAPPTGVKLRVDKADKQASLPGSGCSSAQAMRSDARFPGRPEIENLIQQFRGTSGRREPEARVPAVREDFRQSHRPPPTGCPRPYRRCERMRSETATDETNHVDAGHTCL